MEIKKAARRQWFACSVTSTNKLNGTYGRGKT